MINKRQSKEAALRVVCIPRTTLLFSRAGWSTLANHPQHKKAHAGLVSEDLKTIDDVNNSIT